MISPPHSPLTNGRNNNHPTSGQDLTVILPTLNEDGHIKALIEEIRSRLSQSIILVVDDQSTDETPTVVAAMAKTDNRVRLIERIGRPCLSQSIMTGVRSSTTEFVAWMDADFSHPPAVLANLYQMARVSGCAIATRYARPEGTRTQKQTSKGQNDILLASVLSAVLNFFIHNILKLRVSDYTSGFIVCRRELLANHSFIGDYGEYFIELMYFLDRSGITIQELPYQSPPRRSGYSKTGTNLFKLTRRGVKYVIVVMRMMLPKKIFGHFSYARPRLRTAPRPR